MRQKPPRNAACLASRPHRPLTYFAGEVVKVRSGRRSSVWALLSVITLLTVPTALTSQASAAPPKTAAAPAKPSAGLPDPTARGPFGHQVIEEAKFGLADIEEPNSDGAAPTTGTAQ